MEETNDQWADRIMQRLDLPQPSPTEGKAILDIGNRLALQLVNAAHEHGTRAEAVMLSAASCVLGFALFVLQDLEKIAPGVKRRALDKVPKDAEAFEGYLRREIVPMVRKAQ